MSWTQDPAFWKDMTQKGLNFEQSEQQLGAKQPGLGREEARRLLRKR